MKRRKFITLHGAHSGPFVTPSKGSGRVGWKAQSPGATCLRESLTTRWKRGIIPPLHE
jgi:hypothetical protein